MTAMRSAGRRCGVVAWLAVAWLLGGGPQSPGVLAAQPPSPRTHLLIVAGISGDPAYRDAFHETALALATAATGRFGLPDSSVIVLSEDPARNPARIAGRSTHEEVARALARMATRSAPDDQVIIVLIGHGTEQGGTPRFNLPGPDLAAADLALALNGFAGRSLAVINTASASGGFVESLAGPRRLIITATKSGFEQNAPIFGKHFVAAFTGESADTDKNGRISMLEAFTYASREVARIYEADNRLLTEHARLGGDSALARRFFLGAGGASATARQSPALTSLHATRDSLERQLEALRGRKAGMDADSYERALESLLVQIARNGQAIRTAESTP